MSLGGFRSRILNSVMYLSTRGTDAPVDFNTALVRGLARDGGLYVPVEYPRLPSGWQQWSYQEAVSGSLAEFGAGDVSDLVAAAHARFDHSEGAPLVEVGGRLILELFHGPTLSFKDHALQVLARLLAERAAGGVVLGATSGDTGSAAIEACRGVLPVVMLFPEGRVSELQRRQMTTVDDARVVVVGVRGTFDDCQSLVKQAFAEVLGLLAVNSINWTRIAVQVGYYLHAAVRIGELFDVVVPTGNFGNAFSAWVAREMGAPIGDIVLATNSNRYLAELTVNGQAQRGGVVQTFAPAMDIQVPSNLERLPVAPDTAFLAGWADDATIAKTIGSVFRGHGYLLDPHSAVAWSVGSGFESERPQVVVATAHPAKFPEVVAEASGVLPEPPPRLAALEDLEERMVTIEPDLDALVSIVVGLDGPTLR